MVKERNRDWLDNKRKIARYVNWEAKLERVKIMEGRDRNRMDGKRKEERLSR